VRKENSLITVRRVISCGVLIIFLSFFAMSSAWGETYFIPLGYNRTLKLTTLPKKLGNILGVAPFQDQRLNKLFIGRYNAPRNRWVSFDSEPLPLEKAIEESVSHAVSQSGVEVIPVRGWDGKADSLKDTKADSILMVVIKRFWVEGRAVSLRTNVKASFHFVFHLGVKQRERVFVQNVFVEKNKTFGMLTSEGIAEWINRTLADTLDAFLRNPY
jgi:hypothetical protein